MAVTRSTGPQICTWLRRLFLKQEYPICIRAAAPDHKDAEWPEAAAHQLWVAKNVGLLYRSSVFFFALTMLGWFSVSSCAHHNSTDD
jgi:hypothetical protein